MRSGSGWIEFFVQSIGCNTRVVVVGVSLFLILLDGDVGRGFGGDAEGVEGFFAVLLGEGVEGFVAVAGVTEDLVVSYAVVFHQFGESVFDVFGGEFGFAGVRGDSGRVGDVDAG